MSLPGWYYLELGEEIGPISLEDLRGRAFNGMVERNTPIRMEGGRQWVEAGGMPDLFPPIIARAVAAPAYWAAPIARPINEPLAETSPIVYVVVGLFCAAWLAIGFAAGGLALFIIWASAFIGAFCCSIVAILQKKDPLMSAMIGILLGPLIGLFAVLLSSSPEVK